MDKIVHKSGGFASPTYKTWRGMKTRCTNPGNASFKNYGAKGISYCERWEVFQNFLDDMGPRPEGMTLDRIDSSKDYSPENCRWATWEEQHANKDTALKVDGKMLIRLAEEHGIAYATLWRRIKKLGWSVERALTTPVRPLRRCSS